MANPIIEGLDDLLDAIRYLGLEVDHNLDEAVDADDLAALLAAVYDVRRELQLVESSVGNHLHERLENPWDELPLPGGGTVKFRGGNRPKRYDGDRVRSMLANRIVDDLADSLGVGRDLADMDTGEAHELDAIVGRVVDTVAEATGATAPSFTGWRSGVAKRLGIRLKDYVTEGERTPVQPVIIGRDRV